MSITDAGPAGYKYQYDVTAWLTLVWRDRAPLKVMVEAGQEDATFHLTVDGVQRTVEAQMKSEKGPIGEEKLAEWLAHFPAHQDENSLLEQLRAQSALCVLFVLAAATTSTVAPLCISNPDEALTPRTSAPLTRIAAKSLLKAFAAVYEHSKPDSLDAKRHSRCSAIATSMKEDALRDISRRVFVMPQHDLQLIHLRTAAVLNKKFLVAQSQADTLLGPLSDIVEEGVRDHLDIASRIYAEATRRGHRLLLPSSRPHLRRAEEDELFEVLNTRNIVFLTGLPNAGKTHIGRALASAWQNLGYHAEEGSEINWARRFLGEVGSEERIFLLDDPLGQISPARDAFQTMWSLQRLLGDVDNHRKLVITSRADILRSVLGEPPWVIDGHSVYDVSLDERDTAVSIWMTYAGAESRVVPEIFASVAEFLRHQQAGELLQPGQIRHLAKELHAQPNIRQEDWASIARYDGLQIGNVLCTVSPEMRDLLAALRILTSTTVAVSEVDLAFVLADDEGKPPGRDHWLDRDPFIGNPHTPPTFPSYSSNLRLSREYGELLDQLTERGLLERTDVGYRFSHPSYALAAEQAMRRPQPNMWARLLAFFRRAIFCLSARNAMMAVDVVEILHGDTKSAAQKEKIVALVYDGYRTTIFPSVQDRCLLWLFKRRNELRNDDYLQVLRTVRDWQSGHSGITWDERGEAWLDPRHRGPRSASLMAASIRERFEKIPESAQRALRDARPDERLRPDVLWMHLYRSRAGEVRSEAVERAFFYDESFLRAHAAWIAMRDHPNRAAWVNRAFQDDHPRVFAAGLDGLLSTWDDQYHLIRVEVLKGVLDAEMPPERAIAALRLLKVDDYGSDDDPPAEAWARIVARALSVVPAEERVNAGDVMHYANSFLPNVEPALALAVVRAWNAWAERAVRARHCSDETVDIGRLWMLVTGADASLRPRVIERLLQQPDTTFFLHSVVDLVDNWNLLDEKEQSLLLETLEGDRPDARWARAAALTRRSPPAAVVKHLLGAEGALHKMLHRGLEPARPQLLEDCLRIADDAGGPLGIGAWRRYILLFIRLSLEPEHPQFERALRSCVEMRSWDRLSRFWTQRMWPKLCCTGEDTRNRVFEILLSATIRIRSLDFEDLWLTLLQTSPATETASWASRILQYVEAIEANDNWAIFLKSENLAIILLRGLPRDYTWLRLDYQHLPTELLRALVEELYEGGGPRLERTHDEVLSALGVDSRRGASQTEMADTLIQRVRTAKRLGIDAGGRQLDDMRLAIEYDIQDCMWLHRGAEEDHS